VYPTTTTTTVTSVTTPRHTCETRVTLCDSGLRLEEEERRGRWPLLMARALVFPEMGWCTSSDSEEIPY
jgi:hypothetical protein